MVPPALLLPSLSAQAIPLGMVTWPTPRMDVMKPCTVLQSFAVTTSIDIRISRLVRTAFRTLVGTLVLIVLLKPIDPTVMLAFVVDVLNEPTNLRRPQLLGTRCRNRCKWLPRRLTALSVTCNALTLLCALPPPLLTRVARVLDDPTRSTRGEMLISYASTTMKITFVVNVTYVTPRPPTTVFDYLPDALLAVAVSLAALADLFVVVPPRSLCSRRRNVWPVLLVLVVPLSCDAAPALTPNDIAFAHAQAALPLLSPLATESIQFAPQAGTVVKPLTKLPVDTKLGERMAKLMETILPLDYIEDAVSREEVLDLLTRKSSNDRPAHRFLVGSVLPSELIIPT